MAVKASSVHFDIDIHPVVPVTGMNDQWGHIYVQNRIGIATNSVVKLSFDHRWYITHESNPMPVITGDTATWLLTSISPASHAPVDIYYVLRDVSAPLPIGDRVMGGFSASPFVGDANISNNIVVREDTIKSGCDPNYIENMPAGCIPLNTGTTQIQYNIHFENTGNDTAHNIYVLDTLSPNVNPHSLKVLMASASMNISIINDNGYNVVKFDFPQINLLDSSHHGLCDGVVMYTINTLSHLPSLATIDGKAGIYFDTNPVVLTNIVENRVDCPKAFIPNLIVGEKVDIYPNPCLDKLTVSANIGIYKNILVTNNVGQALIQQHISTPSTIIDISSFPSGMYYVQLLKGDGSYIVEKFVKM